MNAQKLMACVLVFFAICGFTAAQSSDAALFKQEYEALNGVLASDGVHKHRSIDIPSEVPVQYADFEQLNALFERGTGIVYLGFPECPWCRTLVPALWEGIVRTGYKGMLLYSDLREVRDTLRLDDDGNIAVEKAATPEYTALVDILYDWLGEYEGLQDPSIRRIYFPTTVFVRAGEITSVHLDTLEEQEDPYVPLETELYETLVDSLVEQIQALR